MKFSPDGRSPPAWLFQITKICFFFYENGWIVTKLTHDGPQTQGQVWRQRSADTATFVTSYLLNPARFQTAVRASTIYTIHGVTGMTGVRHTNRGRASPKCGATGGPYMPTIMIFA